MRLTKESLLTILRDRSIPQNQFRKVSDKLSRLIAIESAEELRLKIVEVAPLTAHREPRPAEKIILIPILRSGLAFLPAFMDAYDEALVGFIGIKRDEITALPYQYYESIPEIFPNDIIFILDPMIATGGSADTAIQLLLKKGALPSHIFLIGIIASSEGIQTINAQFPEVKIKVVAIDKELNVQKFIVPGLGDFGDRYFGIA